MGGAGACQPGGRRRGGEHGHAKANGAGRACARKQADRERGDPGGAQQAGQGHRRAGERARAEEAQQKAGEQGWSAGFAPSVPGEFEEVAVGDA